MKPLLDTDPMPFGKHKGKPMSDVPVKYLHWMWHEFGKNSNSEVADYVKRNLEALKTEDHDLIWS